jgi:hypothetical protein
MHKGIYNGNEILYIITDASDKDYVNIISEKQEWDIQLSTAINDIPENNLQKIIYF